MDELPSNASELRPIESVRLIHLAAPEVQVDERYLRQRCAWCGAVLLDYDLARVAAPLGQDPRPSTWPAGAYVAVDGGASWIVATIDDPIPSNSCLRLDPEITR